MPRRGWAWFGGGVLAAGAAGVGGCFGDGEVTRCTTADDCSAPFLCCVGGTAVDVEGGPHCVIPDPALSVCSGYLPHLVEGNRVAASPRRPTRRR